MLSDAREQVLAKQAEYDKRGNEGNSAFGQVMPPQVGAIDEAWPLQCALRLEDHLSRTFQHGKPYNDKSRSLLFNLGDPKNPNPRLILLTKKVTPEEFLCMDVRLMASDEVQEHREKELKSSMHNKRTDWDTEEVKA